MEQSKKRQTCTGCVYEGIHFSPEFSAKKEKPLTSSSKPPNKQIWINTNSFRRFRRAFTFFWFGITRVARFRSRMPGRAVPASASATSMRIQEVQQSQKEKDEGLETNLLLRVSGADFSPGGG